MGASYVTNPIEFLLNTLFGLYILTVMLRFLLAAVRADFYNPVSQFLVKVTNPPLIPLRRIIPSVGKIDISSLVLMLLLQMAVLAIIGLLRGGQFSIGVLLILSIAELVGLFERLEAVPFGSRRTGGTDSPTQRGKRRIG